MVAVAEDPALQQTAAIQSLVRQLTNQSRRQNEAFHLVVVPDDGSPRIETVAEIEALVDRLRELLGQSCNCFAFLGSHMPMSTGEHRYLKTPYGVMPLFEYPSEDDLDWSNDGFMGTEHLQEAVPASMAIQRPTVRPPTPAASSFDDLPVGSG